ncbi:hypothetical protein Tco_0437114, partial [Tanacetum coccineum]
MLANAYSRIDVFGGKISLEVGKEQVVFNANEGATPVTVLLVCVIKFFDEIDNINRPDDLEEFLMDDSFNGDLGNLLRIIFELIRQNTNETRWKQKDQSRV